MESPGRWVPTSGGRGILVTIAILLPDAVAAASDADIIGKAIGVSLATSLITTLVTLGVCFLIQKTSRKSQEEKLKREAAERASVLSSKSSASSTRQLTRGHSYEPVSTNEGQNGDVRNQNHRYRSDFIAKWCTEHGLSEQTASILRRNGFISQDAVNSLRLDIIPRLQLNNIGQECILRRIIAPNAPRVSESSTGMLRQRSTSEENMSGGLSPVISPDLSGASSTFERTQSVDHLDGPLPSGRPLGAPMVKKKSIGSMEILEGEQTIIIRSNSHQDAYDGPGIVHKTLMGADRKNYNPKNFKGLLSDQGLHELSGWIGHEWNHLATLLEIPPPTIEQLQIDHPKNIRQQIFEMLRLWRDHARGNKEQVKGILHTALDKVGRADLAEDLLLEQVEGSTEKVAYHSIV